MRYNLKSIMTRAWEIKRENTDNIFSICLKAAWSEAKNNNGIASFLNENGVLFGVKDWFVKKNFDNNMLNAYYKSSLLVEKVSEKAVYIKAVSKYGKFYFWCPKSCLLKSSSEEFSNFVSGMAYNSKLIIFAKSNGIKGVRKGMKTVTIINKIKNAGFEVPTK